MQAVYIDDIETIRVGTREIPKPGNDEILLSVRSAGICGSDIHILKGEFGVLPVIPVTNFAEMWLRLERTSPLTILAIA